MKLLNEILGIEFPLIQGGMANIATGAFAAAVSNAGALGLIASGGMDADALRREIHQCRDLTDKPFGVNLMLMNPHVADIAPMLAEEHVRVITTGAGNPGQYIPVWKDSGAMVMPVVPASVLARRLERYGIDGVIAEGGESGGHIGEMNTMALIPQVVDAVQVPVVAAGGIADGRQLAAALSLGACGAQVGTCLLVSEECPIHPNYKQAVLKAKETDTMVTGRSTGAPVRVLKNRMAKEYVKMEKENLPLEEMEKLTLGSLRRAVLDGDTDTGSLMAGEVAGMLHEILPLRTIFERMMAQCRETISAIGGYRL